MLARIYSHRYSTPPAYEPPPPYHVALQMETEGQKPPEYFPVEVDTAGEPPEYFPVEVDTGEPPEYSSSMTSEKQITAPLETLV